VPNPLKGNPATIAKPTADTEREFVNVACRLEHSAHRTGEDSSAAAPRARETPPFDIPTLTRRMVEGNEEAYRMFHSAYVDRLARYLLVAAAGNEDTMREALQRTLARVVRHIRVFPSEEVFWSWLTVLARSGLFDETRTRRRYLGFLERFTRHVAIEREAGAEAGMRVGEQLDERLERQLALLPADERELIEQKYYEHAAVATLAAQRHVTEKAIESRLTRIRAKLKDAVLAELHHERRA
jgi:RNA polymerase sigma factor (sigma-70 family)